MRKLDKLLSAPSKEDAPPNPPPDPKPTVLPKPKAKPETKTEKVNDALRAARSKRKGTKNDDAKQTDGGARGFNILKPGTWDRNLW